MRCEFIRVCVFCTCVYVCAKERAHVFNFCFPVIPDEGQCAFV